MLDVCVWVGGGTERIFIKVRRTNNMKLQNERRKSLTTQVTLRDFLAGELGRTVPACGRGDGGGRADRGRSDYGGLHHVLRVLSMPLVIREP